MRNYDNATTRPKRPVASANANPNNKLGVVFELQTDFS